MRTSNIAAYLLTGTAVVTAATVALTDPTPTDRTAELAAPTAELDLMLAAAADNIYTLDQAARAQEVYMRSAGPITPIYGELLDITPTGGVLKLNGNPIRYWDARGNLRAIYTALVAYEQYGVEVLVNTTNTVETTIYPDGAVVLETPEGDTLASTPVAVEWVAEGESQLVASGAALREKPDKPDKPSKVRRKLVEDNIRDPKRREPIKMKQELPEKVVHRDLFSDGTKLERTILPGGVKEDIVLQVKPAIPRDATHMAVVYQWKAPGLKLTQDNGALVWMRGDDAAFRLPVLPAIDADGKRVQLEYVFDDGTYTVQCPADFLRKAAYPVTIDPYTTTSTFTAAVWTDQAASGAGNDELGAIWFKVTLPAIDGTVSAVDLTLTAYTSQPSSLGSMSLASYGVANTSWTEATAGTALVGMSTTSLIDTTVIASPNTSGDTWSWDVLGSSGETDSVAYAYTLGCANRPWSLKLRNNAGDHVVGSGGGVPIEVNDLDDEIIVSLCSYGFLSSVDPYLTITYTGNLGCGTVEASGNSGTAGALMF